MRADHTVLAQNESALIGERRSKLELGFHAHARAGRLLTITQGGVKDQHAVAIVTSGLWLVTLGVAVHRFSSGTKNPSSISTGPS